jgi:pyruvate-ferredoxin/flavodoxin oxidoreductase
MYCLMRTAQHRPVPRLMRSAVSQSTSLYGIPTKCIECTFCSYVCPHAVIRPVAMTEEEAKAAPEGMQIKDLVGMPGYKFAIVVSALDCTGCGSCQNVCPGMKGEKALTMVDLEANAGEQKYFDYGVTIAQKEEVVDKFKEASVKGSQFKKPLLEFSGACAGCGETPYAKLITQLFGDQNVHLQCNRLLLHLGQLLTVHTVHGNAKGQDRHGATLCLKTTPSSDTACFSLRTQSVQYLAAKFRFLQTRAMRQRRNGWIPLNHGAANGKSYRCTARFSRRMTAPEAKERSEEQGFPGKEVTVDLRRRRLGIRYRLRRTRSCSCFSGQDVNVLVVNTEVYSNTGGQSSKATPLGAVAQFAAGGKETKQKDLASIAMSYGYVYVAQIAMGADMNQAVKAIAEAEAYPGPSLIIAYAPCINHHIKVKGGMSKVMDEEKAAVQTGYWNLFRYNPDGEKKFSLDSKAASAPYSDFLEPRSPLHLSAAQESGEG